MPIKNAEKNVKIDTQKYAAPPIIPIKTKNKKNTFRNTFIRGPPYNAYKNTRKNNLNDKHKAKKKPNGKIEPHKYVYQGSPLLFL